jgi:hypothetical protein
VGKQFHCVRVSRGYTIKKKIGITDMLILIKMQVLLF